MSFILLVPSSCFHPVHSTATLQLLRFRLNSTSFNHLLSSAQAAPVPISSALPFVHQLCFMSLIANIDVGNPPGCFCYPSPVRLLLHPIVSTAVRLLRSPKSKSPAASTRIHTANPPPTNPPVTTSCTTPPPNPPNWRGDRAARAEQNLKSSAHQTRRAVILDRTIMQTVIQDLA
jgi:hypothetical protein